MFARRPLAARHRVTSATNMGASPSFTPRHATADFTEGDDDDDDEGHSNMDRNPFDESHVQDEDQDEADEGADEDGRLDSDGHGRSLPVLPLFSATHLGMPALVPSRRRNFVMGFMY
jgi:hypothetical protein